MVQFVKEFCSIDEFEDASGTLWRQGAFSRLEYSNVSHLQFYESMNKVISFLHEYFPDLQKNCPNQLCITKLHTLLKSKYDLWIVHYSGSQYVWGRIWDSLTKLYPLSWGILRP